MRARIGMLLAVVVAVAGCEFTFGERQASEGPGSIPSASATPSPVDDEGPATDISAPGRLAVVGADGSLSTMRPDGSDPVTMDVEGIAVQPSWSPDGRRLAWVVQRTSEGGGVGGSIVVAGPRGERPVVTRAPFIPYYLAWSPTGDRIAFLGAGGDPAQPVAMGVLDLSVDPPRTRTVTAGQPFFYFAWSPDGRRVLAHSGYDRLDEVDLAGRTTRVSRRPGVFAAPAWSADGRTLVYAERAGGGVQRLMAVVDGRDPRVLVEGRGSLAFVLRPDGNAVAYQLLGQDDGDLFDRRPTQAGDGVRVVDVRTGITRRATSIRAMTFWWSPDGERLLALAPEPAAPDTIPFLWQVWDGGRSTPESGRHSPTIQVLQDYAPFFTQYAQSATPWSPDGSAFAFPVSEPDGGGGTIVVQEVGGEPVPVGPGVYVTWSP
jgi:Tol biopolymer transport system component